MKKFNDISRVFKICFAVAAVFVIALLFDTKALAAEQLTGELKTVSQNTVAYGSMDLSADTVTLMSGEAFFVTGEEGDWVKILYKGEEMYIPKSDEAAVSAYQNDDVAAEMEKRQQIDQSWIESYVSTGKAIRSARIWRIAMILVIVGVIAFVVVTSIRHSLSGDKKEGKR